MEHSIARALAAQGIHARPEDLAQIQAQWDGILELKQGLDSIALTDADIALRNLPGGDHA